MGPQSLLYMPVELLRNAPPDAGARTSAEHGERRYALPVVVFLCADLVGALLWWALG